MTSGMQAEQPEARDLVALATAAYDEAERAYGIGNYKRAEELFSEAVALVPNHPELLVRRGYTRLQLGRPQTARNDFAQVMRLPKERMKPQIYRSAIAGIIQEYFGTGEHQKVAGLLAQDISKVEGVPALMGFAALSLIYTGNIEAVPAVASAILAQKRLHPRIDLVASIMARCGLRDEGVSLLESLVRRAPNSAGPIKHFIRTLVEVGACDSAEATRKRCRRATCLTEAPVYTSYQIARYFDVTDRIGVFDGMPETPITLQKTAMDPAVTGLSRLEYGPEEIAQEAFVETPTVDDKTLIGSIARLHRMIAAWKADGAFNAQLGNIQAVRDAYAPDARDPIQIISTGRCGTTALSQFCQQQEGLAPFHSFELGVLAIDRNHLLYRLLTNALDNDVLLELTRQYLRNRTAELIWAYRQNCTPLISSHWDTIFAPAMVELFPGSRFIHLSRDPTDVFRSIYGKNQWQFAQLMPLRFDTDFPAGRFIARVDESLEIEERVAWYLHLTGVLCSALKTALSADRWLALKSEDLFAATPEAFEALDRIMPLDAAGSAAFQTHFDTPRNTKDELEDVERNDLNMRAIRIPALMSRLAASGRI